MHSAHGLTFIELMLALAVIAVLVSIGIPSLAAFVQESRMVAAGNRVVTTLNLARSRAVFERAHTMMCPSTDGRTCTGGNRWDNGWIVFSDGDRSGQPTRESDLLRVEEGFENIHADSGGRTGIRYKPDGMAHGFNLTIKLCHPDDAERHRAVTVSNPGRIRSGPLPDHLSCPDA